MSSSPDDEFTISSTPIGADAVLVEIAGPLDMETVPGATEHLVEATANRPEHLILDLGRVTFLGSSGIAMLAAARADDAEIHGDLHLLGVTGNRTIERPLALVALTDRFDTAPDLDTLLDGLDISRAGH